MTYSFGWIPDLPDVRDYHDETPAVQDILQHSKTYKAGAVPAKVDLRPWCSPIENQKTLGSCTAHAGIGLLEYTQRHAFGKHLDLSRLFLYKTTRKLAGLTGDSGAFLRSTMQAMVMLGSLPEKFYPYTDDPQKFDAEPAAFHYALAQSYKGLKYYRLDTPKVTGQALLDKIKQTLAAKLPAMFGFTVYSSIGDDAWIPAPKPGDTVEGGHAVLAVGYDDTQGGGALLIRNSWGTGWGHKGYGWLPVSYILDGLADDFWTLVDASFVDTDLFR